MTSRPQHVIFGTGILGLTIARQLAESGASVRLVIRSGTTHLPGVTAAKGDLSDPNSAIAAAKGADVICFCAASPCHDWSSSFMALQERAIAAARQIGAVPVAAENLYGPGVAGTLHEKSAADRRQPQGGDPYQNELLAVRGPCRGRDPCGVRPRIRLHRPPRADVGSGRAVLA